MGSRRRRRVVVVVASMCNVIRGTRVYGLCPQKWGSICLFFMYFIWGSGSLG